MKKLLKLGVLMLICMPVLVLANGSISVSNGSLSIVKGSSQTINVCGNNAAGRVDISVSGNISVNTTSVWVDMGCSPVTVTGNDVGNATITFNVVDATDYDGNDLTGTVLTTNVNVYVPAPQPETPPVTPPSGGGGTTTKKKNNTDLNTIKVGDYTVTKEGDTYKVLIEDDIEKVTISAIPSDSNAKVTGDGEKSIVDGDNKFNIKVTAQNGNVKTYALIITKSSAYISVDKIEENLSLDKVTLDVKLQDDDILSSDLISKIKNSTKIVNLYYFNSDNELLYIWVLDAASIQESSDFNPIINVNTEKYDQVFSRINYVDSIIFELKSTAPEGARLRYNIAKKYSSNDNLNAYSYNDAEITLTSSNSSDKVNFGIIHTNFYEFPTNNDIIYIITKGTLVDKEIPTLAPHIVEEKPKSYLVPLIIESVVLVGLVAYIIIVSIQNKRKLASIMSGQEINAAPEVEIEKVITEQEIPKETEETKEVPPVENEKVTEETFINNSPEEIKDEPVNNNQEIVLENVKVEMLEPAKVDTTQNVEASSETFDKKDE